MKIKPVYGRRFHVTPKRWWRPSHRKAARTAAAILDYEPIQPGRFIYYDARKYTPRWPA